MLVLSGSQSGLSSIFRALVGPGRPLLVESPTYWGAILAAAQAGVTLVPVPSGPDGPDPDELDRAFAETGARAFYAQPTYANPTGAQWSASRARAVLDVVRDHGAFLIEDDWAHDLAIDTDPQPIAARDDDGHVDLPALADQERLAGAAGRCRDRPRARPANGSWPTAPPSRCTSAGCCRPPRSTSSPNRAGAATCAVCGSSCGRAGTCWSTVFASTRRGAHIERVPAGGLNLWVRLPDGTDVDASRPRLRSPRRDHRTGRGVVPGRTPGPSSD